MRSCLVCQIGQGNSKVKCFRECIEGVGESTVFWGSAGAKVWANGPSGKAAHRALDAWRRFCHGSHVELDGKALATQHIWRILLNISRVRIRSPATHRGCLSPCPYAHWATAPGTGGRADGAVRRRPGDSWRCPRPGTPEDMTSCAVLRHRTPAGGRPAWQLSFQPVVNRSGRWR